MTLLLLSGCATQSAEKTYRQITMEEAITMMEEETGYIILDVRTAQEYSEKHIPEAINIANESIGTEEMTVARLVCGINRLAQMKHLQSLVFAHGFGHKKRAPIHSRCGANRRSMYITIFNFICYNCMVLKTSAFFD